ncbi:recombinase family protein [Alicyclobacillus sp. ALC3]|uniref:recombinase family protein n=1 Tax=Alicyclobacillus sp. ALC3 TaxID=2796143 RepID=UPI0023793AEF|nr:recombinase family protein [Alicyclobacillus sp. ALC3]WDL98645.1 recombinase family protein [Alicyclobacillus sp. ALC3]
MYARVSTDRQGESLDNQVDYAKEYIRRLGDEFAVDATCVYTDFDQSGYYTRFIQRPAIQQALEDAKQGRFHVIVFKEISRISRDQAEHIEIVSRFQMHGVRVIAINDNVDSDRPETLDLLGIHSVMSEMESKRISSRVSSGKKSLARRGVWLGEAPIGYRLCEKARRLEIDAQFAATVVAIFRMYVDENKGTLRIADHLNRTCQYSKNGKLWSRFTVNRVLQNPVYVGDTVYGRTRNTLKRIFDERGYRKQKARHVLPEDEWVTVRDTHPPLVDRAVFDKAQALLRSRSKPGAKHSKHPLTGLLRCERCGETMVCQVQRQAKREYRYYVCSKAFRFGRSMCSQPNIRADELEQAIWTYLICLLTPLQQVNVTVEAVPQTTDVERELARLRNEISKAELALEKLLLDDSMPVSTATRLKERYVATINQCNCEVDELEVRRLRQSCDERVNYQVADYLQSLGGLGHSNPEEVRRMLQSVIRRVTVNGKQITSLELNYRLP